MALLSSVVPFIIVLSILVFVHELGHFLSARRHGVKVEVFSIGFGAELFGFNDAKGTRWKFSLIPLGGYVKMLGDADASSRPDEATLQQLSEEEKKQTLNSKSVYQRIEVSFAGPLANFVFAIFLMMGLFYFKGLPEVPAVIGKVSTEGVANQAGIQEGDKILSINGKTIETFKDLRELVRKSVNQEQVVELERPQTGKMILTITPKTTQEGESKVGQWGVLPTSMPVFKTLSLFDSLTQSFKVTYDMTVATLEGIGQIIVGKRSSEELGGILSIGDMASQSAKSGISALLWFMCILSINLGILNLLPIPVLDGGHILMYTIEAIRGKPLSLKIQERIFAVGFVAVVTLMILGTWNDLMRYEVFQKINAGFHMIVSTFHAALSML